MIALLSIAVIIAGGVMALAFVWQLTYYCATNILHLVFSLAATVGIIALCALGVVSMM